MKTLHLADPFSPLLEGHRRTHCELDYDPATMQAAIPQEFAETVQVLTADRALNPRPAYVDEWEICSACNVVVQEWVDRSINPRPGDGTVHLDPAELSTDTLLPDIIREPLAQLASQRKTTCGKPGRGATMLTPEQILEQDEERTTCRECLGFVAKIVAYMQVTTSTVCDGGPFRERCPHDRRVARAGDACPNCAAGPFGDAARPTTT